MKLKASKEMDRPRTAMPTSLATDGTVTVSELSRLTGYSVSTIHYRLNQGYIPVERAADGSYRIPVSEVAQLARRPKYARYPNA